MEPSARETRTSAAQLVKLYDEPVEGKRRERKYSPAVCTGTSVVRVEGNPDPARSAHRATDPHDADEYGRVTRLTNAFPKKVENHAYAAVLHFMFYNFCRIHQTLRVTPAMAAGPD